MLHQRTAKHRVQQFLLLIGLLTVMLAFLIKGADFLIGADYFDASCSYGTLEDVQACQASFANPYSSTNLVQTTYCDSLEYINNPTYPAPADDYQSSLINWLLPHALAAPSCNPRPTLFSSLLGKVGLAKVPQNSYNALLPALNPATNPYAQTSQPSFTQRLIMGFSYPKPVPSPSPTVPLYLQKDPKWAAIPYGNKGTIGSSGCAPTAAAMVLSYYGIATKPPAAAQQSIDLGCQVEAGTERKYFQLLALEEGLSYDASLPIAYTSPAERDQAWQRVITHLKLGRPVIVSGRGPTPFTKTGHFIVLVRLNSNGTITVQDPNGQSGSYSADLIRQYHTFAAVMFR